MYISLIKIFDCTKPNPNYKSAHIILTFIITSQNKILYKHQIIFECINVKYQSYNKVYKKNKY